jgi:hypothetical protein
LLRDLDQPALLTKIQRALKRDSAFRLEVFCRDSSKSLDRLKTAFKEQGISLQIDPEAQARLKLRGLPPCLALFVEDLTQEELVKILQKLGADDRAAAARNPKDGQFGDKTTVIKAMNHKDRSELGKLLGVDPQKLQPARHVSDGTASQVADALSRPRPDSGRPAAQPTARSALVVTYLTPAPGRPASKEVKQFLDGRKEPRPSTIQVFLVLQN